MQTHPINQMLGLLYLREKTSPSYFKTLWFGKKCLNTMPRLGELVPKNLISLNGQDDWRFSL